MLGLLIILFLSLWILITIVATVTRTRKKGLKGAFIGFMIALSLTACDTRTMEQVQADRIKECKAVIQTTLPDISHLPLTERGQYIEEAERWERCRELIEDTQQLGEFERFPKDFDFKKFTYMKRAGTFIKIPKEMKTYHGIWISYQFKHKYLKEVYGTNTYEAKQYTGIVYSMDSINSLNVSAKIRQTTPDIDNACQSPSAKGFSWNDILFLPSFRMDHIGDNVKNFQEDWKFFCPIAVKAVKDNLSIFQLEPEQTKPQS